MLKPFLGELRELADSNGRHLEGKMSNITAEDLHVYIT